MYKHSLPKNTVILVIVAALAVSLLSGCSVLKGKSAADYCVYIKDNELFITDFTEDGTHQLTTQLLRENREEVIEEYNEGEWLILAAEIGHNLARITNDCKYVLYPDKWTRDGDIHSFALYYRSLDDIEAEPFKVDSNVNRYILSSDGKFITYLKESGNYYAIYEYSFEEQEKTKLGFTLDQNFNIAVNGSKSYIDENGNLYLKHEGKDAVKLDSNVDSIINQAYVPDTIDTVYYMKNNAVYSASSCEDKVKLVSNIDDPSSILKIYDSGCMYFVRQNEGQTLLDYVDDGYADSDASFTPADEPVRPRSYDYDTYEEYGIALDIYEEEYEAYRLSLEQDKEIEARYELREELTEMSTDSYSLYYFNGEKETVLSENADKTACSVCETTPEIAYVTYTSKAIEKRNIGDIDDVYLFQDAIYKALHSSPEIYLAIGDSSCSLGENAQVSSNVAVSDDGSAVYYLSSDGDLYFASIKGEKLQKAQLYASDVGIIRAFMSDGDPLYFNFSNADTLDPNSGNMYIAKEKIAENVYTLSFSYADSISDNMLSINNNTNSVIYFSDHLLHAGSGCGTLNIYSDGKIQKIADEAYSNIFTHESGYTQTPGGAVIYFSDWDDDSWIGQLCIWRDGKNSVIADNVQYFCSIYDPDYAYIG